MMPERRGCESTATCGELDGIHLEMSLFRYFISSISFQRSAALSAKARLSCAKRRQLLSFGKRTSSAGVRVMMVGGGKEAVRAVRGYMPQKTCWTDSRARGIGVARKYIMSADEMSGGMNLSWST